MDAAVEFRSAGLRHQDRRLLDDFSLEVAGGEVVCLTGPAGCGKSTAIRMALGLSLATSGKVVSVGVDPAKAGYFGRTRMRRRISAVLDDIVFPALPAEAWVAAGVWCGGERWAASLKKARAALDLAGTSLEAGKPLGSLKPCARAAISLAGAMARRPALLLIDLEGFGEMEVPVELSAAVSAFIRDGGACLCAGEPPAWLAELKPRIAKMEKGAS